MRRDQGWDDYPIAFGTIADEVLAVDSKIHRLTQPHIAPRAPRFAHVELAKHCHEAATVLHHCGKRTFGHPQGVQRIQLTDEVHTAFPSLDQLHGFFLAQRVVKDDPVQPRQAIAIPIVEVGFQDDAV